MFISFIAAYYPVWRFLVSAWSDSADYSHGFFIIPLGLFILWGKRKTFEKLKPQPSRWGLVLVVLSLFTYIFARFAQIITLSSLSMIPLFAGIILYLYGYVFLWESAFALFLLFFMIPIPSQIYSAFTIHLQLAVTKASVLIAGLLGVPVYREGNVIHLADRTLQVVRACSGMRSMISLLTLSAVFGYFTLKSNVLYYHLIKAKRSNYPFLSPPLLAQKFIKIDRDLKTVVGDGQVVEAHWRQQADETMWKMNIDGGGTGVWGYVPEEALDLSVKLALDLKA